MKKSINSKASLKKKLLHAFRSCRAKRVAQVKPRKLAKANFEHIHMQRAKLGPEGVETECGGIVTVYTISKWIENDWQ